MPNSIEHNRNGILFWHDFSLPAPVACHDLRNSIRRTFFLKYMFLAIYDDDVMVRYITRNIIK